MEKRSSAVGVINLEIGGQGISQHKPPIATRPPPMGSMKSQKPPKTGTTAGAAVVQQQAGKENNGSRRQSNLGILNTANRSHSYQKPITASTPKGTTSFQITGQASSGVSRLSQGGSQTRTAGGNWPKQQSNNQEEEKQPKKQGLFTNKPSDRFSKIKTADPFSSGGKQKHKTNFGFVYSAGGVPCRVDHGSVHHKIHWDKKPQDLDYDPLLINCFEGLLESDHPYAFVANQALIELLQAPMATEKTIPLIGKLIMPLRAAFLSADNAIWIKGLNALKLLAETTGHHISPHIHILLAQLNKKMTLNKKVRDSVMQVLNTIEERGGKEALEAIRQKIPTYTSIYM